MTQYIEVHERGMNGPIGSVNTFDSGYSKSTFLPGNLNFIMYTNCTKQCLSWTPVTNYIVEAKTNGNQVMWHSPWLKSRSFALYTDITHNEEGFHLSVLVLWVPATLCVLHLKVRQYQ